MKSAKSRSEKDSQSVIPRPISKDINQKNSDYDSLYSSKHENNQHQEANEGASEARRGTRADEAALADQDEQNEQFEERKILKGEADVMNEESYVKDDITKQMQQDIEIKTGKADQCERNFDQQ